MKQVKLGGVHGAAAVKVAQGDLAASGNGNIAAPARDTAILAYALHDSVARPAEPVSVTGMTDWNGQDLGYGYAPGVLADQRFVVAFEGDRVIVDDLGMFASYTPEMYSEGRIEFRRVVDGEMILVGQADAVAARFDMQDVVSGLQQAVTATRYSHRIDGFNRFNVPYWFTVAGVLADGSVGPRAGWVSCTPTAGSSTAVTNPAVDVPTAPAAAAAIAAPGSLAAKLADSGTVALSWAAVKGVVGYRVWIAYNDPATWPDNVGEITIANATGTPAAGDMMIWRREVFALRASMIGSRIYDANGNLGLVPQVVTRGFYNEEKDETGYEIRTWEKDDKPSGDLGDYFMRRTIKPGGSIHDGIFWSGPSNQTYYRYKNPGEVFCVDVWIRASRPVTLNFSSGLPGEPWQEHAITDEWVQYHFESDYALEPEKYAEGGVSLWFLRVTAEDTALEVDFAQLRPYLKGVPYGRLPEQMEAGFAKGSRLRDHMLIKTHPTTYTAGKALAPAGEGHSGWTCGMHFAFCRDHGLVPWVQLEWIWFKEDWLRWMDWLAGEHGDFEEILLELGNENWNPMGGFWFMPYMIDQATGENLSNGYVYGMMSTMIWGWLKESPHWPVIGPKLKLVIGGQLGSSFGEDAFRKCPEATYVTVAQYNGGWDVNKEYLKEDGETYWSILRFLGGQGNLAKRETALRAVAAEVGKTVGVDVFHDVYEGGPGYQQNGLNGISVTAQDVIDQEVAQKSRAAAACQLDAVCVAWSREWVSNFFILGKGNSWRTHNAQNEEYLTYAVSRAIGQILGKFRVHKLYTMNMTQSDGVEDVGTYAFESLDIPGRWLYVALNRLPDRTVLKSDDAMYDGADSGLRAVTFRTHHGAAASCKVFLGGIGNMREHNRWEPGRRLTGDGAWVEDPFCVAFDTGWHDIAVPDNPGMIVIDDTVGADPGGLRGGNFIMVCLDGTS